MALKFLISVVSLFLLLSVGLCAIDIMYGKEYLSWGWPIGGSIVALIVLSRRR